MYQIHESKICLWKMFKFRCFYRSLAKYAHVSSTRSKTTPNKPSGSSYASDDVCIDIIEHCGHNQTNCLCGSQNRITSIMHVPIRCFSREMHSPAISLPCHFMCENDEAITSVSSRDTKLVYGIGSDWTEYGLSEFRFDMHRKYIRFGQCLCVGCAIERNTIRKLRA